MSNLIDNLLLSETASNSPNSTSIVEQPNKDKPSLFDSLLSNISSSEETKIGDTNINSNTINSLKPQIQDVNLETNISVETNSLNGESLIDSVDSELMSSENSENLDKSFNKSNEQKITNTASLLDKLIIEAKQETTLQANKDKPSLFDSLLSTIPLSDGIDKIDALDFAKVEIKEPLLENINKVVSDGGTNIEIVDGLDDKLVNNIGVVLNTDENNLLKSLENTQIIQSDKVSGKITEVNIQNNSDVGNRLISENIQSESDVSIENSQVINNQMIESSELVLSNKDLIEKDNPVKSTTNSLFDKLVAITKKDIEKVLDNPTRELLDKSDIDENLIPDENNLEKVAIASLDIEDKLMQEEINSDNLKNLNVDLENKNNGVIPVLENNLQSNNKTSKVEIDKLEKIDANLNDESKDIFKEASLVVANFDNTSEKIEAQTNNIIDTNSIQKIDLTNTLQPSLSDEAIIVDQDITDKVDDQNKLETVKKADKLSLMDQLIQKNSEKLILTDSINDNLIDTATTEVIKKDLISSIYLGSQKNKMNNQSLFNKNEAVSILKEGDSVQAIKTSAEILDLGLEDISFDESVELEKLDLKQLNKKGILENLLLQKNVKSEEIKHIITTSIEASKALIENNITIANDTMVNVNSPIAYNIQSKIIGAKQQMATMMSDISRQMYENYKPPVTAFKINLNPTELGSIAILMKSDKNSGLSITMNVSNNVTLDTLIENQNVLKNSLNKTFDENTKFNLDFGSSNQNSNNQSSNNQNQNNRQFEQQMDTQSILQLKEENKDIEEKVIDYM